jgi:hypothetical protein
MRRGYSKVVPGTFLLFALVSEFEPVIAANVYITKGEGGAGLEAYFECKRHRDKLTFSIDLHFTKATKSVTGIRELVEC